MTLLIIASNNDGKIAEFQRLMVDFPFEIQPQYDFDVPPYEETACTFIENAIGKARHVAFHTGHAALADDSGLCVDILGGAPGVLSARYAGVHGNDAANCEKLLESLNEVPAIERNARFHCVLALVRHAQDPLPVICEGSWEGSITEEAMGEAGFGYDPLFWVPELACTAAQLHPEQKNQLSHRGKALRLLQEKCQQHAF